MSAVAPAGAVEARLAFVFTQTAANGGGAVHIDNVSFRNLNLRDTADADRDGDVDGSDFLQWQRNSGSQASEPGEGDFNSDGAVDGHDLQLWKEQMGDPASPANEAAEQGASLQIPEPSTTMLALSTIAALLSMRTAGDFEES